MENATKDYRKLSANLRRISAGSFALALAAMQVTPAYATINNSVTASGTAPGGAPVTANTSATVSVETAAPGITLVKAASFKVPADDGDGDGKGDQADKITYTYTVTNSGNVTVKNVGISDAHDGIVPLSALVVPTAVTTDAGSAPAGTLNDSSDATGDFTWDTLGPGDTITFEATYIVQVGDITRAGGGAVPDGDLDNSATASATFTSGASVTPVSSVSATSVPLDTNDAITIAKSASPSSNVAAGTTVTYTYVVTNTGNTQVANIELHDTHKGNIDYLTPAFSSFTTNTGSTMGTGPTANTITILKPGDVAVFTATYIVTQSDVDTLQ